jgi:hypothetical protein
MEKNYAKINNMRVKNSSEKEKAVGNLNKIRVELTEKKRQLELAKKDNEMYFPISNESFIIM